MPFPVQIGRWGRGLARLFGIQGQVPLTLLEDVAPMLAITRPDGFLMGDLPWGADLTQPAVAGQFAFCAIGNPEGSGQVVRVSWVQSTSNTAMAIGILPGAVAPTQLARGRDSRVGVFGAAASSGSIAKVGVGSGAVALLNTGVESSGRVGAGSSSGIFHGEEPVYILTPGFRLVVEATVVNVAAGIVFHWTESPLAPQELVA